MQARMILKYRMVARPADICDFHVIMSADDCPKGGGDLGKAAFVAGGAEMSYPELLRSIRKMRAIRRWHEPEWIDPRDGSVDAESLFKCRRRGHDVIGPAEEGGVKFFRKDGEALPVIVWKPVAFKRTVNIIVDQIDEFVLPIERATHDSGMVASN